MIRLAAIGKVTNWGRKILFIDKAAFLSFTGCYVLGAELVIKRSIAMATSIPTSYKKLSAVKFSTNFREAVKVVTVDTPQPKEKEILVKNKFVGINATDINVTAGRYLSDGKLPFDIGIEGVGEVVAVGSKVKNISVGQTVGYLGKAYAEYTAVSENAVFPISEIKPEYITLLLSGLTAAIGLDKSGRITEGETVLITAAAGGCGHIAVQWAKAAGCHVIGTCSTEKKASVLKNLGCDRVINYKSEDLGAVLKKEYPNGIDVIWETIGGKVFETLLGCLATKGRLIIVGGITGYKSDTALPPVNLSYLPQLLLSKSAAVQGLMVRHYAESFPTYFTYLRDRFLEGKIKVLLDSGKESTGEEFFGMDGIIKGVEYLHTGKSLGKVIVKMH